MTLPGAPAGDPELLAVLGDARSRGFLGPGPVERHVEHALGFAGAWDGPSPGRAVDLGSGGGVPGLVLALVWPSSTWALVESNLRKSRFLADAIDRLDLAARVEVIVDRAEIAARDLQWRMGFDAVVSRGFGPPAVVAECAAGFLRVGGRLLVSEPPEEVDRWPVDGLALVGLVPGADVAGRYRVFRQADPCPDRYPRRVGIPAKRPLFR